MNYKAFSVVRQVEGIMQSQEMSLVGENKRISIKSEFPSSSAQMHTISCQSGFVVSDMTGDQVPSCLPDLD